MALLSRISERVLALTSWYYSSEDSKVGALSTCTIRSVLDFFIESLTMLPYPHLERLFEMRKALALLSTEVASMQMRSNFEDASLFFASLM